MDLGVLFGNFGDTYFGQPMPFYQNEGQHLQAYQIFIPPPLKLFSGELDKYGVFIKTSKVGFLDR